MKYTAGNRSKRSRRHEKNNFHARNTHTVNCCPHICLHSLLHNVDALRAAGKFGSVGAGGVTAPPDLACFAVVIFPIEGDHSFMYGVASQSRGKSARGKAYTRRCRR